MNKSILDFHSNKIIPEPNSGCWIWTGSTCSCGYGRVKVGKKNEGAHRLAFILHFGEIKNGLHVLHKCDVRCCVNPEHLFLGTHKENMNDMKLKKRAISPGWPGEKNKMAKLKEEEVLAILNDTRPRKEIARTYGVCTATVNFIKLGERWPNVYRKWREGLKFFCEEVR